MLQRVVSVGLGTHPSQQASQELRYALRSQIIKRLKDAVFEGELPENADVEVLSCLCISFASGLAAILQDGISVTSLVDSVALFVESVGLNKVRPPKRRPRNSHQVLTLVKR
jgi:hypothetical protein